MKIRQIDMIFAHVRFASDCRTVMHTERYSLELVSAVSGISPAAIKDLMSAMHKNPEMRTFLGICNALDLNPINYFDLSE